MFGRAPHRDLLVEPDRLYLTDSSTGRTCTARAGEPSAITAVEREALRTALLNAGCRKVIFEGLN